jgi:hypothetical protein
VIPVGHLRNDGPEVFVALIFWIQQPLVSVRSSLLQVVSKVGPSEKYIVCVGREAIVGEISTP